VLGGIATVGAQAAQKCPYLRRPVGSPVRGSIDNSLLHIGHYDPQVNEAAQVKEELPITTKARQKSRTMGPDDPRLAGAIFTLREAAGYLDAPKSNIQRWARPPEGKRPLITCFPPRRREATVPFVGFAEAFVLSSFRRAGVPLQRIRPAVEILEKEIGVDHALASKRLYADGAEILFDYANRCDEPEVMDLVVVRTQQRHFSGVVKDYLKCIHYKGDGWADSVRLPTYGIAKVVVDPKVAFGLPLIVCGGARVQDLVDRFQAGDSVADIAADFSVPAGEVEDVIRLATRACWRSAPGAWRRRPRR
jgi:uncharacterized protein (DUF433 family)